MTDDNLKDVTTTWVTFSFIILCLIAFTGQFMNANAPNALGDTSGILDDISNNITGTLIELDTEANKQLNISSLVSSENSQQGLYVSSTNSYGFLETALNSFKSTFRLVYFVLSNPFADIVVDIFSGLLGLAILFYIVKLGRSFF